jgi:hypothetical protein
MLKNARRCAADAKDENTLIGTVLHLLRTYTCSCICFIFLFNPSCSPGNLIEAYEPTVVREQMCGYFRSRDNHRKKSIFRLLQENTEESHNKGYPTHTFGMWDISSILERQSQIEIMVKFKAN